MLILAILTGWWLLHRSALRHIPEQAQRTNTIPSQQTNQAPNENAERNRQASELPRPTNQPEGQKPTEQSVPHTQSNRIVTFALVEGSVRDIGESNRFAVPGDASFVRLQIKIEHNDYKTYRADLRKAEGVLVWQHGGIRSESTTAGKATIALQLPARALTKGDYILKLRGATTGGRSEVVAEYSFRVVEK